MKRSNYHDAGKQDRCYFCPENRELEEHHIVPQQFGGSDDAKNIVTVCSRCHDKLERLYDARFYESFGIDDEQGKRLHHRRCMHHSCSAYATHSYIETGIGGDGVVFRCDDHPRNHTVSTDLNNLNTS